MVLYRYIELIKEDFGHEVYLHCFELKVIRETKACYIINGGKNGRYILKSEGKKRFAYPTKKEALVGLEQRKISQIWRNKSSIKIAENTLEAIEQLRKS